MAPAFEDWIETGESSHRVLAATINAAALAENGEQAKMRSHLETRRISLLEEKQRLLDERNQLLAGPPPPPAAPATRDASSRVGRCGAPLWQACEFQSLLDPPQRAALEAALESSGLLDAWIFPDGSISVDLPFDTFLTTASPAQSGATLSTWLQPDQALDAGSGLSPSIIRSVLSRIGAGPSGGDHWVALDGSWKLGPVIGRGRKPEAVHLGAASREASRLRRLNEVETEISKIEDQEVGLENDLQLLERRIRDAVREQMEAPGDDGISAILTLRTEASRQLQLAELDHENAVKLTVVAREAEREADDRLKQDVRSLGYGAHLHRLGELRASWSPYKEAMIQLWANARAWMIAVSQVESAAGRRRVQAEQVETLVGEADQAHQASIAAAEAYRTLSLRLGDSIDDYQKKLEAARRDKVLAQDSLKTASERLSDAGQRRAVLESNLSHEGEKKARAEQSRSEAIGDLRVPLKHGLFTEADPALADIETDEWSPSRAYAIARRLDRELPASDLSDTAWTSRIDQLHAQIHELRTLTGALGCNVVSRELAEGLSTVTCHYQGNAFTPAECLHAVELELDTHQRLLGEREREIIDRHLVAEVSLQLQSLIEGARYRTDQMNAEMSQCATTLGVALKLGWEPVHDGLPPALPHVRKLLISDHAAWTDEERKTVGYFLHQLIKEERIRNPSASGAEQLLRALDYRRWHAFFVERRQNDRWERLNRKRYGTGSGGEKALMLTIPQMAAAASHYRNAAPHAPRFILLDEAFAGMDKPTRAKCMGLLETFNLDLLMTSEREWGAHATVSGIAIYQLVADSEAVAATRWVWNGSRTVLAPVPDTPEFRESHSGDATGHES